MQSNLLHFLVAGVASLASLCGCTSVDAAREAEALDSPAAEGPGGGPAKVLTEDAESGREGGGGGGAEPAVDPAADPAAAKRLMVYTADYEVLAPNPQDAITAFLRKVESLGGYVESRANERVTVRVPAARFSELIAAVPSFGVVVKESFRALDVTKEHRDLNLRIETAEKARQRLAALLERADQVEDILRIEQELRRLTEEIERFKGELRYLSDRIAYSTIAILFRSSAPEARPLPRRARSRFEWINEIGVERVLSDF